MRIAWWTPLPPQKSGIADYSVDLINELKGHVEVLIVVRDDVAPEVAAFSEVPVVAATAYRAGEVGSCDLDVYQMGNHFGFHGYMHSAIIEQPGLLVLHDMALLDFYAFACGAMSSPVLLEQLRADDPALSEGIPTILVDGIEEPDRLRATMSRRVIEASLLTLVHSKWVRDQFAERYPSAHIRNIRQPVPILTPSVVDTHRTRKELIFGVFGSLERHKRVAVAVRAFSRVHASFPNSCRLLITGRADNPSVEREVREVIDESGFADSIELETDVPFSDLEAQIRRCDVSICLRWPTAGEVSASLMRSLGAGKPVITSDVPQYRDLDPAFCWRIPIGSPAETSELEAIMRQLILHSEQVDAAGLAALQFVKTEAELPATAERYLDAIAEARQLRRRRTAPVSPEGDDRSTVPGVNVIGDWQATTGLAESARRSVSAMIEAGVAVAANQQEIPGTPRNGERMPQWLRELPQGRTHEIDICYLNVNELHVMTDEQLRPIGSNNYLIGYWFWELPALARAFLDQLDRVDEIWVGSNFTREALLGHTDKPIRVMPCVVKLTPRASASRRDLDLPERACLFLLHFDAFSTFSRKNPWAVIRAFCRAFTPEERSRQARLVLKTINLSRTPAAASERLVREMRNANGILLDTEMPRAELASLLHCADVYVSLHRSEGFGLGIAEAMLAGRPAIATAYSGNLEFMTHQNSCLVGYRLQPVTNAESHYNPGMDSVYEPGQLWAEADIDQAARWMRALYESPALRERIGAAGQETIRSRFTSETAGAAAASRLRELAATGWSRQGSLPTNELSAFGSKATLRLSSLRQLASSSEVAREPTEDATGDDTP